MGSLYLGLVSYISPVDNKVIRSTGDAHTMYTIDGPNSDKLYFSIRSVVDIWQMTTYDIIIAAGSIALQKDSQRIKNSTVGGLNAFALIKTTTLSYEQLSDRPHQTR